MPEKLLFIEATAGASGDMFLGALMDLGVPVEVFREAWDKLKIENYEIEVFETRKSGMRALRCRVRTEEEQGPRNWKQYQKLIKDSGLPAAIKNPTVSLIQNLFEMEAAIHKTSLQKLALHEMGGTDLLIDVVGTLCGFAYLKASRIVCSPINTGHGFLRFSHGQYPVPAPVTAKLLEGIPIFQNEVAGELTTPTGALLLRHLAHEYGPLPAMTLEKVGIGAGEREIQGHPNVLRLFAGSSSADVGNEYDKDAVFMIETNIDDANPQILAYFMDRAFQDGALDVFFTPVVMKKNRPGVCLSVLAPGGIMQELMKILFAETTAIGLRYWRVDRKKLDRKWKNLRIEKQDVRIKESYLNGKLYNYQPEYEDCKAAAEKLKMPVKEIIAQAIHLYLQKK